MNKSYLLQTWFWLLLIIKEVGVNNTVHRPTTKKIQMNLYFSWSATDCCQLVFLLFFVIFTLLCGLIISCLLLICKTETTCWCVFSSQNVILNQLWTNLTMPSFKNNFFSNQFVTTTDVVVTSVRNILVWCICLLWAF